MKMKTYPWSKRQAKALWRSVEHHLKNLQYPLAAQYRASVCACCNLRVDNPSSPNQGMRAYDADCEGCPIYLATGKRYCGGIAYIQAYEAWRAYLDALYGVRNSAFEPVEDLAFREQDFRKAQTRLYQDLVEIALGDPNNG